MADAARRTLRSDTRVHPRSPALSRRLAPGPHLVPLPRPLPGYALVSSLNSAPSSSPRTSRTTSIAAARSAGNEVRVLRGREVRVEADRPVPYGADGEVEADLPVMARVLPGALQVLS